MLHVDITLEASRLIASRNNELGEWNCRTIDKLSGMNATFTANDEQFACLVALGVGGEEVWSELNTRNMYLVAEPLVKDLPTELRFIP